MANYLIHFNPYHDKLGRFDKAPFNKSKLPSYGGEGINAPIYKSLPRGDKRAEQLKELYENDYIIKKGSQYNRITSTPNEKFNKRMYVSGGYYQYEEVLGELGTASYLDVYQTKKDVVIAGKKTIEKILNDIGGEPASKIIKALNTDWLDKNSSDDYYDRNNDGKPYVDFLYKDTYGIANEFISRLQNAGYDGLPDPFDSGMGPAGNGLDDDATIFINDVLNKKSSTQTVY